MAPETAPAEGDSALQLQKQDKPIFREFGRSGLRQSGGTVWAEPLRELEGDQGRATFREMSENDATIGRILYAIEQVVLSVEWHVEPGEGPDGERAAEHLESCMLDMSHTWEDFITEVLTMLVYGWAYFEQVLKRREGPHPSSPERNSKYTDGKLGWRKFAIRDQNTLDHWEFDEAGGIQGMHQADPNSGEVVYIPIEKALLFRTKPAGGNPEGKSMLRRAYRTWAFKKRCEEIEGIGIERDLAGLPVIQPPEDVDLFSSSDALMVAQYARCQQLVTSIRIDDQAGVVLPHGWEFRLERGGGPKSMDVNEVLRRYDWNITATVLAQFLELGKGEAGSWALGRSHKDLFAQSIRGMCNQRIAATINRFAVAPLMRFNGFRLETDPAIVAGDPAQPMLEDVAEHVASLAKVGIITPDEELEAHLRQLGGLPEAEEPEEAEQDETAKPQIEGGEGAAEAAEEGVSARQPKTAGALIREGKHEHSHEPA
jgi:hypothetical protein